MGIPLPLAKHNHSIGNGSGHVHYNRPTMTDASTHALQYTNSEHYTASVLVRLLRGNPAPHIISFNDLFITNMADLPLISILN